jgi:hypothetical protein
VVKANKKLKNIVFSKNQFDELKNIIKKQNSKIFDDAKSKLSEINKNNNQFEMRHALKDSQMIPFSTHYESENAISYSMYLRYKTDSKGQNDVVAATATIVNLAGRVVYLFCYGSVDDLEWTQATSKNWVISTVNCNEAPPLSTTDRKIGKKNVNKATEESLRGIFAVALLLLAAWILTVRDKRLKNKKNSQSKDGFCKN